MPCGAVTITIFGPAECSEDDGHDGPHAAVVHGIPLVWNRAPVDDLPDGVVDITTARRARRV